ncbi:MAG: tyrosine-type recombinase/integrase [Magnetococcales bacterium]|nr:tyrosine-type recombinase/integrase [Magnetococcales bacterium]
MAKITKRIVDGVKADGREQFVWDQEIPGFGLRVFGSGKRSYVIQYKVNGRTKRMSLGPHGRLTPEEARKEARKLLGQVSGGGDPAGEKKRANQSGTVAKLVERYLEDYVAIHNRASTAKEFSRLANSWIVPELGTMRVEAVGRQDVIKLHQSMKATPRQANHALAVLSRMFSLAEVWELRPEGSNPCRLIRKFPENSRERFLSEKELTCLGNAIDDLILKAEAPSDAFMAIRLLALTGCRLGEILGLKWEHVDFEQGCFQLPYAKAGNRQHPIGDTVIELLKQWPKRKGCPWVVSNKDHVAPLSASTVESIWRQVRNAAKLKDVRIHDLRHTVGTYAGQTGANAYQVRDKLGHRTLAMTGRYVNRLAPSLRDLSNDIEQRISGAMGSRVVSSVENGE